MAPNASAIRRRSSTESTAITSRGARRARRLDRAEPDRPEAEHRDALAGLQLRLGDGVIAGAHHVAGEQGDVVGEALRDRPQGQVGAGNQQLVGLGPLQGAEGGAVAEDPAAVALVEVAPAAEEALRRRR